MANSATMSSDFNAKAYDGKPAFIWCYEKGHAYVVDAVTSSGILKAKQKLGITFNSDRLGGIDFTKFSKLSMRSAGAGRCWLVQ